MRRSDGHRHGRAGLPVPERIPDHGPGTNGSQFFLVYEDSQLPPTYTVFGTIDSTGLATLEKVAAAGVAGGSDDDKPVLDVTIKSVQIG